MSRALEKAKQLALETPYIKGRQRVAAIALDKRGRVISYGVNSYCKTHPEQKDLAEKVGNPDACFLHAEVAAIVKAKRPIHKLVVARIGSTGEFLPSYPCPICLLAIKESEVLSLEFTP